MICKHCGTEIADKAIVCYRCGAGTSDPVRQPPARRRSSPILSFVLFVLLLLMGLYMGYASPTAADPDTYRTIAGVFVGAALVVLVLRVVRRRR